MIELPSVQEQLTFKVKPSFSIHFRLSYCPIGHYCNMYGLKSLINAQFISEELAKENNITEVIIKAQWKKSRMGRWICQEVRIK